MFWPTNFIISQLKGVRVTYEFKEETEEAIKKALHDEAVERLRRIQDVLYTDEMTSEEKVDYMMDNILPFE